MASPRDDRRSKGGNVWGKGNVAMPLADKTTPDVEVDKTVRVHQLPQCVGSTVPNFGTAHPDTANYPNCFLKTIESEPGDNTDQNFHLGYVTLPGTSLASKKTTQWGPATVTTQAVAYGSATGATSTTEDASVTAEDKVESHLQISNYDALPTPWLYGYEVDPDTNIGTRVQKRLNVNGTRGGISSAGTVSITNATVANPTVLTLSSPIPTMNGSANTLITGEWITIAGDTNATVSGLATGLNGNWPMTIIDPTHVSVALNVTSVSGSGFGTVRMAALVYQEIQQLNDRQCIEIWSQIDSSTLPGATKIWQGNIDYSWPSVLVGIDYFTDTGSDTSNLVGGWPIPTQITWVNGNNTDVQVGIRTQRYSAKTFATITRSYSIGAPVIDSSTVQEIKTSNGEVVMEGTGQTIHTALSVAGGGASGVQTSTNSTVHWKTARIENVLTNGFTSSSTIGAFVTLKLDASIPVTFSPGSTFIASSDVTPGRLGLFSNQTVTITVPTDFPA